jgi:hypothetical protein
MAIKEVSRLDAAALVLRKVNPSYLVYIAQSLKQLWPILKGEDDLVEILDFLEKLLVGSLFYHRH